MEETTFSFPIGLHVRLSLQANQHGNGKKGLQTYNRQMPPLSPSWCVEGKSILKEKNPKNTFLVEVLFRGKVK
jgi:hypothetical protein